MSVDPNDLFHKVVSTVRASTALAAKDVDFCRSLDVDVAASIDSNATEVMEMINGVLTSIDPHSDQLESGKDKLEDSWKDFSNLMDALFEKSDRSLDILTKRHTYTQEAKSLQYLDESQDKESSPLVRISKPQLQFERPVDNSESHPFIPLLVEKPHSMKPLSECLRLIPEEDDMPEHYSQPYSYEIDHQEYDASVLVKSDPIPSQPWNGTEAIWVDNMESLHDLLLELKKYKEIAVDLEHHDYRSYYGIVCLMQISTRDKDYLIDTISLREKLKILNEVFADPQIVKIFHGAFMDVIWLQRDLGLYVVSLFDTYHASRAVGLPRFSLAYLLEKYSNFKTSKKYQLADWRVRPLPKAMAAYARSDTHFLLNIYDQLRNQLIQENKLAGVLFESRKVAKRRFEYAAYRPKIPLASVYSSAEKANAWQTLMYQYNIPPEKEMLLKKLYEWRDMISRRDDESSRFVMPNQLLVALVSYAPVDSIGVVSASNMMSDHVRSNSKEIANLIRKTEELPGSNSIHQSPKFKQSRSNIDIVKVLTITQVQQKVSQFKTLSESHASKNSIDTAGSSSLLLGDILSKNYAASEYLDGRAIEITDSQLKHRALEPLAKLSAFDNATSYTVSVVAKSENSENEKKQPNHITKEDRNATSNETDSKKPEMKENMDEIVTLKVSKGSGKKFRGNDLSKSSTVDVIDYNKSEKILQKNSGERNKNARKRSFDPYSAPNNSSGAPKTPKRRKATNRGKSASFKK
ncbi:hypothetical protein HG535_0G02900 [Zygotorulaspora mrakii]|uniref:HRDC domain-containing protein n=1 Tax=Zygotorulaspora mrakii TaxID=42260 RepID=A0A7H9B747_ZYGMR|nr:uncharacterized protein HG535_0G02900 [Zygotorulaspora mrakii]QLG74407.1 hypothetical protein HG535_0G02900 [Zygotorulaspora mrakii]